jgi:hypothetical protein
MHRPILITLAVVVATLLAATWTTGAVAAQSPNKDAALADETDRERLERKIKKLLKDNGTQATQKRTMEQMIEQFDAMGMSPDFGKEFMAKFDLEELEEMSVKIHADHLEEETVDALLAFFATESGKKFAEALPEITVEMTKVGMEYGQRIALEIIEDGDK